MSKKYLDFYTCNATERSQTSLNRCVRSHVRIDLVGSLAVYAWFSFFFFSFIYLYIAYRTQNTSSTSSSMQCVPSSATASAVAAAQISEYRKRSQWIAYIRRGRARQRKKIESGKRERTELRYHTTKPTGTEQEEAKKNNKNTNLLSSAKALTEEQ